MSLPAYQAPNALNFEPIQQGFNAISQNALARNQQGMEQQRLTSELQTQGLQRQQVQQNIAKQHLDLLGGVAQDIDGEKDPAVRAQRWSNIARTFDDQDAAAFKQMGVDPNDAANAPQAVMAMVRGYQNPLDVQQKKLAIDKAKQDLAIGRVVPISAGGSIAELGPDGRMRIVGGGDIFSPEEIAAAGRGGQSQSQPQSTQPNAEPVGNPASPGTQPSPQARAFPPGAVVGGVAVGTVANHKDGSSVTWDGNQWVPPNLQGTPYPYGTPQAGDPGPLSNPGSPLTRSPTAPYDTPEDMRMINKINKNPRAAAAMEKTPGYVGRIEQAKDAAKSRNEIEQTQRGVVPMYNAITQMENRFAQVGPDVAGKAIGPNYGEGHDPGSWIPQVLPDTAGQSYQNLRALGQTINPFTGPSKTYADAANLNQELHHFKEGIATLFKAIPGSGKGGATDQAQQTLEEMVDRAIHARDAETFYRITHAAKNFILGLGQYPQLQEPKSYLPPTWQGSK